MYPCQNLLESFPSSITIDWGRFPFLGVLILKLAIAIVLVSAKFLLPVPVLPPAGSSVERVPQNSQTVLPVECTFGS